MAFLSQKEIEKIGFKSFGKNVQISDGARFYNAANISLGDHVRIDDFALLSAGKGGIELGSYVHIAIHCGLVGAEKITMENFSGLSSRVFLYSSSDDFSGKALTNPTLPDEYRNVKTAPVHLGEHVIIGTCATVMPGVRIGRGAAIGAYSYVSRNIKEFMIANGRPCKAVKKRSREYLKMVEKLIDQH